MYFIESFFKFRRSYFVDLIDVHLTCYVQSAELYKKDGYGTMAGYTLYEILFVGFYVPQMDSLHGLRFWDDSQSVMEE